VIAIVDDQSEVLRGQQAGASLVGNVDSIHSLHIVSDFKGKTAVAGSELHKDGPGGKVITNESKFSQIGSARELFVSSPRKAGMIRNLTEELVIHGGVDMPALFPAGDFESLGDSFFDQVMVLDLFEGAIGGKWSK